MFESKTVMVVGAGASAEFGLPTGNSVFKDALELPPKPNRFDARVAGFSFDNGFDKFLMGQSANRLWNQYENFVSRARQSAAPSIDRLAWLNAEIADVCRAFSTWSIFKCLYDGRMESLNDYGRRKVRAQYFKSNKHLDPIVRDNQNWIAAIANKWIGEATSSSELDPEILSFVTFNYDRLIEEGMNHFVRSSARFTDTDHQSLPKVHHVHGSFPQLPNELTAQYMMEAQTHIKYIEDGGDDSAVQGARRAIDEACHVICVGFDFDPKNVSLSGLQDHADKLYVLNYDGNEALQNRVIGLRAAGDRVLSGTFDKPMGLSMAVARGFLDQPELTSKTRPTAFVALSERNRRQRH